jgi:hypothetical protein
MVSTVVAIIVLMTGALDGVTKVVVPSFWAEYEMVVV